MEVKKFVAHDLLEAIEFFSNSLQFKRFFSTKNFLRHCAIKLSNEKMNKLERLTPETFLPKNLPKGAS
jgi:hypothetical protein